MPLGTFPRIRSALAWEPVKKPPPFGSDQFRRCLQHRITAGDSAAITCILSYRYLSVDPKHLLDWSFLTDSDMKNRFLR